MRDFKFFQKIDEEEEALNRLVNTVEELSQTVDRLTESQNQLQIEIERFLYNLNTRNDERV